MRETKLCKKNSFINIIEFDSTNDLVSYIKNAKTTPWFRNCALSDSQNIEMYKFSSTMSFDEAFRMLRDGWATGAKKIEGQFKLIKGMSLDSKYTKFVQDVVGFQPIVANYLMGIPKSMVSSKIVAKKQKVVTLNMTMSFNCGTRASVMEANCLNVLKIVKAIEASGCRVNLNVFCSVKVYDTDIRKLKYGLIRLRVKNADERLNISKVAFPIVHPSYLRRIMLRVIETNVFFTSDFTRGYGSAIYDREFIDIYGDMMKGQYLIPMHLEDDEIKDAESVYAKLIRL